MGSIMNGLREQKERVLGEIEIEFKKQRDGWKKIDGIDLPPENYYFLRIYACREEGLRPSEIRTFIEHLINKRKIEWEIAHQMRIIFDEKTGKIIEEYIEKKE